MEQETKESITVSLEVVEKMMAQTLTSVFGYLAHELSDDEAYDLMTDNQYPKILAGKIIETYRIDNFKKLNDLIRLKMEEKANV